MCPPLRFRMLHHEICRKRCKKCQTRYKAWWYKARIDGLYRGLSTAVFRTVIYGFNLN